MRKWVVKQQAYLGQVLEESLPNAAEWAERQGQSLVTAYNLSQVSNLPSACMVVVLPILRGWLLISAVNLN
jgi:ABC-type transporter Mla MlaB component